jgi:hypothetical protein
VSLAQGNHKPQQTAHTPGFTFGTQVAQANRTQVTIDQTREGVRNADRPDSAYGLEYLGGHVSTERRNHQ